LNFTVSLEDIGDGRQSTAIGSKQAPAFATRVDSGLSMTSCHQFKGKKPRSRMLLWWHTIQTKRTSGHHQRPTSRTLKRYDEKKYA